MSHSVPLRALPDWEPLRRQIYARAMRFTDHLGFDFRELLTDASCLDMAGRLMWALIKPFAPQVLVGPGYGSAPLLFAVALAALRDNVVLQVLMVRERRKDHNMKKWVEGARVPAGARALIVDDFMKAGSALELVEKALAADKHTLDLCGVAVFFDMWEPLGSRQISVSRYPLVALYTRHDIGLSRDCFDARPPTMKGDYPEFIQQRLWWRFDLNSTEHYPHKCAPVIADGAVYVADDASRVWKHRLDDGAIVWRYDSLARPLKGIVQLLQHAEDSLVFGCYDGTVTRLDAHSGAPLWRWRQDSSVHATPALDLPARRLFINTEQWNRGSPIGHLQCLDWDSGRLRWSYAHKYWPPGSPIHDAASAAVVATCNDQTVVCVDADTGVMRWKQKTTGLVRGQPGVYQGRVYLATESGRLHCYDLASGDLVWTVRYGKGQMHNFVRIIEACVVVFDGKWHATMFDADTGAIRWIGRLRSPGVMCPVSYGRYAVALSRAGHLAVFDPSREIKVWEGSIDGRFRQPPALASGCLAVASNDSGLAVYAVDPFYAQ